MKLFVHETNLKREYRPLSAVAGHLHLPPKVMLSIALFF
jgi:hypothetical protein